MSLRHQTSHWVKYSWGGRILLMVTLLILSYIAGYALMDMLMEYGL